MRLPENGVLYIKRFFCKIVRRTLSFLPDFLLPRKHYTNRFVEEVLESYLGGKRKLCATSLKYALHYQTIQKWLRGLSSKRETKAICFARHGPFSNVTSIPDEKYARWFWDILKRAFRGKASGVLTAAGGLLWAEYECPLF